MHTERLNVCVVWISKQRGAWVHARTRGVWRVIIADTTQPRFWWARSRACREIVWESPDCTRDYGGGAYGFAGPLNHAEAVARRIAATRGLPFE